MNECSVTFTVVHLLLPFSNVISLTAVQHLKRSQLTLHLADSRALW